MSIPVWVYIRGICNPLYLTAPFTVARYGINKVALIDKQKKNAIYIKHRIISSY